MPANHLLLPLVLVSFMLLSTLVAASEGPSDIGVSVQYFNDSTRSVPGNLSYRFDAGETAYYTVCVYNSTDLTPLSGTVDFSREKYSDQFQINGCYNGSFIVGSDDRSGWWYTSIAFNNTPVYGDNNYIVEPIFSAVWLWPRREFDCAWDKWGFVPNDTLYLQLTAVDQAGQPINQDLFDYDFFNQTTVSVYNVTGDLIGTTVSEITYYRLATYVYNCTDPYTNETVTITARNVANRAVLPDYYDHWSADVLVNSSYGTANSSTDITMPITAKNPLLSLTGTMNPGRNITVTFDGWVNARDEEVIPDYNEIYVDKENATCDANGCGIGYLGYYNAGYNVTSPFSFIVQDSPGANQQAVRFHSWLGSYNIGMSSENTFNVTNMLNLSLRAPSSITEGDVATISLTVSWANQDPYNALDNVTATISKRAGLQNLTLVRNGNNYSANLLSDQVGTWNITINFTDEYNNTGFAEMNLTVNAKPKPPQPPSGGGGGGGFYIPVNKTNNTNVSTTNVTAPRILSPTPAAPAPQPAIKSEQKTESQNLVGPTGMFVAGGGIAPIIQSIIAAIVGFFAHLFGG